MKSFLFSYLFILVGVHTVALFFHTCTVYSSLESVAASIAILGNLYSENEKNVGCMELIKSVYTFRLGRCSGSHGWIKMKAVVWIYLIGMNRSVIEDCRIFSLYSTQT